MTSGEICKKINKSRKVVLQNLKIAQNEALVIRDRLGLYHLTRLGKSAFSSYVERGADKTSWQIESQVIDNIGWTSNRPSAKCTLLLKNGRKIKEIDNQTAYDVRYKLELPANATAIKSSLAKVVDTVVETIGKYKGLGLNTVRDGQQAESLTPFNIQEQFPGYDSLKRCTKLADTTFKILIEFDGKRWIKTQNPNEIKKHAYNNRKSFAEYHYKQILSQDKRRKINEALQLLADKNDWDKVKNSVKWSHLFENEEELTKHLSQHFESNVEKSNPKEVVDKAFKSGILQRQNKKLIYLTLDPDPKKIQQFYSLLDS